MTIICALRQGAETWIGSDTQCSGSQSFDSDPKWVLAGGWALGLAGDYRAQQVIQERADKVLAGTVHDICRNIRQVILGDGFVPIRDDKDKGWQDTGQIFILAAPGEIWSLDCVLSAAPVGEPFFAKGSGWEFAEGAVFGARKAGEDRPETLMEVAIEAAIKHDEHCGGRVWIERFLGAQ